MAMQNAHAINADLHCHSTVSDGMLSPSEVAARAQFRNFPAASCVPAAVLQWLRRDATAAELVQLLFFATSTRYPSTGITFFAAPAMPDGALPLSHTCFNAVDMPLYGDAATAIANRRRRRASRAHVQAATWTEIGRAHV